MVTAGLSHVILGTSDMPRAEAFYGPLLAMLGWRPRPTDSAPDKLVWQPAGTKRPLFVVMPPFNGADQEVGNGAMVALGAPDRATVDAVYALAINQGGCCEGPPGLRSHYHPDYYGAYVRDLDGNKLCIVCHRAPAADRAAPPPIQLSRAEMIAAAEEWISAWNRRDFEAVLAGFHSAATFRSPIAERITGVAEIAGKTSMRIYWEQALAEMKVLRFTLLNAVCDEASQTLVVHYEATINDKVRRACEVLRFQDGRKIEGEALYG